MKKKNFEIHIDESWLITYADMITLLLCFFAIILSVSEPKKDGFKRLKEALASGFVSDPVNSPFMDMYKQMQEVIEGQQVERDVFVQETQDGVQLELSSDAFFMPDASDLRNDALVTLDELVTAILKLDYKNFTLTVEGFTDDIPTHNTRYASNWELSGERAARVIRFLIDKGIDPERMIAISYGDTHAKVPNLDEYGNPIERNRILNRRIVVTVKHQ